MNEILNDAHVMVWLAWLERLEAQLWTLDGFDSHVTDWLAQLPKNREQKQYEDAFVVFDETVELLEQRERFDDNKKSYAPLESEAADRLIAKLDGKVGTLYQSIGLGPDGKTVSAPVVTISTSSGVEPEKAGPVANWKMQIQAEATALILRLRQSGASPTKHSIVANMARWCRDNNVMTDGKIYPSANYLRTHVLGGKHWDVPN